MIKFHSYEAHERHAPHGHDYATASIVLHGHLEERVGSREVLAGPLSVVVKPADTVHANTFGSAGARIVQMRIPDDSDVGSWRWLHTDAAVVSSFLRLADEFTRSSELCEIAIYDVLAALTPTPGKRKQSIPPWLAATKELLNDGSRPPRLHELAAASGVHPTHFARKFRRVYGLSVSDYIHHRRVVRAVNDMSRARTLTDVAYAAGFADQAHMCRVFKRVTGLTPSAFDGLLFDRWPDD